MRARIFMATAAAVTGFATPGYPVQPLPVAGSYVMVAAVTSVKGTCNNRIGDQIFGMFDYPGPGKRGATLHLPLVNKFAIKVDEFSKTPAVGATTWNGIYVETVLPSGGKTRGTFTGTLVPTDTRSFAGEFATDNHATGCELSLQALFLKTS